MTIIRAGDVISDFVANGVPHEMAVKAISLVPEIDASSKGWVITDDEDDDPYTVTEEEGWKTCSCGIKRCEHILAVMAAERMGRLPTPLTANALNLPAHIKALRPGQVEALRRLRRSRKQYMVLQGPPGSGKTDIAVALCNLMYNRMLYLCHSKTLQDQFMVGHSVDRNGFDYAVELKGRSNYPTLRFPGDFPTIHAGLCRPSHKEKHCRWCCDGNCNPDDPSVCLNRNQCPYSVAKERALRAKVAVLNFDLFLYEANFVGRFSGSKDSGWPLICVDEADELESRLLGFFELVFTKKWIQKLGLNPPAKKTVQDSWVEWASTMAMPKVEKELSKLTNAYGISDIAREKELENMHRKLTFFLKEVQNNTWVFEASDDQWSFKPVFVDNYVYDKVLKHGSKFLFMSGTIISPDEFARSLGLKPSEIDFIDLESTFPPENRPIHVVPVFPFIRDDEVQARQEICKFMDDHILLPGDDKKTLIHSVSYRNAEFLLSNSRNRTRMISYRNANGRTQALNRFKSSKKPLVMVASSMTRGIDLPYDNCRRIIMIKVPFPNLGDKQISKRAYSGKRGELWYAVLTVRAIVQATERGNRTRKDYCEVWILDAKFIEFYRKWRYLFPKWWRAAVKIHNLSEFRK